jgi:hypothetical protein
MNERRLESRRWNFLLAAVCVIAVSDFACGGVDRRPQEGSGGATGSGGAGSGGAPGQGGTSASGGASGGRGGGSGGAVGTGGSGEGGRGEGGEGGEESGGSGGGGGSTEAGGATSAGGAAGAGGVTGEGGGGGATGGAAGAGGVDGGTGGTTGPKACNESTECAAIDPDLVCDPSRGFCVQCASKSDCSDGRECVANKCVTASKCEGQSDCESGKVCDSGKCVACTKDEDCGSSGKKCLQSTCRTSCDTDKTCTPDGLLCHLTLSLCAQCTPQKACPTGSYCDSVGMCQAVVCASGDSMCSGNGVAQCKSDGSGWGSVSDCPDGKLCKAYGGVAGCGGPPVVSDGGVLPGDDGGTNPIDTGPQTCSTATEAPCTSIPKLTGSVSLDGKGDDFCGVPSFHLNAEAVKASGKVNAYNATPPEDATVKVAWTSDGLAVFVDVMDASVQTVNMKDPSHAIDRSYQGDSVELFISSNNNVTGQPGADSNTLHVIIPAEGPAVSVKTTNNSGASTGVPTAWSASQYKQTKTTTGYAIEAVLPWPGGNPEAGAQVRFDIGLNSADSNFGGVDDMRDGQLLYYVGQVSNTSCQASNDGTVPYCDDRTWCTTTLQ